MRLPFTDKFLWDLYNLLEEIDKVSEKFIPPRSMKELLWSHYYRMRRKEEREINRRRFGQLIYYLKKRGYIKIKSLEQKGGVILTKKGKEKVLKVKIKMKKKKMRKDGKWQMIIFDIPEKKRQFRDLLREHLQILSYKMLQKSIWVCPYDVLKETEEIVREYSLDPYVKLFLIEEIEV